MPTLDHRGKFCDFILDPLNSRTGGELIKCQRPAAGWDAFSRGFRCSRHLQRKPHIKRQAPGSQTRPGRPTPPNHPWKDNPIT